MNKPDDLLISVSQRKRSSLSLGWIVPPAKVARAARREWKDWNYVEISECMVLLTDDEFGGCWGWFLVSAVMKLDCFEVRKRKNGKNFMEFTTFWGYEPDTLRLHQTHPHTFRFSFYHFPNKSQSKNEKSFNNLAKLFGFENRWKLR